MTEHSNSPSISAALANCIESTGATAPGAEDRAFLARTEKELLAKYDKLIRTVELKASSSSQPPKRQQRNDCSPASWILKEYTVQRYWDVDHKVPVSRDDLEVGFMSVFLRDAELKSSSYRAFVEDSCNLFWKVCVQSLPDVIEKFHEGLDCWLNQMIDHYNFNLIEVRGELVYFELDPSQPLGANLVQVMHRQKPIGVLVKAKNEPERQFAQTVGNRISLCSVFDIVGTAKDACITTLKFEEVMEIARQTGQLMSLTMKRLPEEHSGLLWHRKDGHLACTSALATQSDTSMHDKCFTTSHDVCTNPLNVSTRYSVLALQEDQMISAPASCQVVQSHASMHQENSPGKEGNESINGSPQVDLAHPQRSDSAESSLIDLSTEGMCLDTVPRSSGEIGDYSLFYNKLSELVELEFRNGANIHKNSAMGILWSRHKKLFGLTCSDDCPCVLRLPELTETVVIDMLKRHSKWNNPMNLGPGDYPVGIAGNFAATFVPLLQQERPEERASKQLERLLAMWRIHQKQRIFGLQCKDGCCCLQGWETSFAKGALPGEYQSNASAQECSHYTPGVVPKKRKVVQNANDSSLAMKEKNWDESHLAQGLQPSVCRPTDHARPSTCIDRSDNQKPLDKPTERQPYAIEFDCIKPLGFYCVTETKPRKYCKVM